MDDIVVARGGFSSQYRGKRVSVHAGQTARVGHWVVSLNPELWRPIRVDYDMPSESEKRGPGRPPKVEQAVEAAKASKPAAD